ncbi:hypothetical protein M8818_001572 [Zalaria obscura]|uniref:Uncharacterized protein n=1 Tax=Zalaria obscura TaxID=2024903 RepID=A0ACC3SL85_9PEZI
MAAPADINAILSALTQRNAGTPAQATPAPGGQPGYPVGYPGAMPQQAPTPSLPGFALPQPTSSGSVDLSAIRPVNSGSVSIADAIAKAKSIAADRGGSFDNRGVPGREDPRLAGRSYMRSRSRSRSPPRRDAFRDNYNPYRDERRGDSRRAGGYGRDRTPSPGPRGRYSPGPARDHRSPQNRGGDGDSETISVKSALQPSYGQMPQASGAMSGMPAMPGMPGMPQQGAGGPAGGDPNAPDPYAQYGGYQNYVALWYAALAQQQQGGQPGGAPQ